MKCEQRENNLHPSVEFVLNFFKMKSNITPPCLKSAATRSCLNISHFQEQDVVTLQELLYMFLQPNTQADLWRKPSVAAVWRRRSEEDPASPSPCPQHIQSAIYWWLIHLFVQACSAALTVLTIRHTVRDKDKAE